MRNFFLPHSDWSFSKQYIDRKWRIEIYQGIKCIVDVSATTEALALKRAWDALSAYCFIGNRSTPKKVE